MNQEQMLILGIIGLTVAAFLWGRWRHDLVALLSLLACVLAGLVPAADAFSGFSHPAVITVAAVLILSQGLRNTGVIDVLAHRTLRAGSGRTMTILSLCGVGAVLSAFMNNVGAMALLMPIAIQAAGRQGIQPAQLLMPLSFATILGGMTTLIGTPPNLIVSGFRAEMGLASFGMFDFSQVGVAVALGGIALVVIGGWRLVPAREKTDAASFATGSYLTEVRVPEGSTAEGMTIGEAEKALADADVQILGMVRRDFRVFTPNRTRVLRTGDLLMIETEPESLASALTRLGLELEPRSEKAADEDEDQEKEKAEDVATPIIREYVSMPNSGLTGQTAEGILLRQRYGINLLAISHQGRRSIRRLQSTTINDGDVLLMQGPAEALAAFASEFSCVPLAERSVGVHDRGRATLAVVFMAMAVGCAAFGLLPAAIAFVGAVVLFVLYRIVPLSELYQDVDWPIIVLLGALLPVAEAMASTGTADLLAQSMIGAVAQGHAVIALALILVVTMTLSDFMNNAATAAVMCPIAISTASGLDANPDAFLMAVAIGASCAMLTPIGHQNNTLIMGPGGLRFGDYWRLGLPMEIVVVAIAIPMLLWVWPL